MIDKEELDAAIAEALGARTDKICKWMNRIFGPFNIMMAMIMWSTSVPVLAC